MSAEYFSICLSLMEKVYSRVNRNYLKNRCSSKMRLVILAKSLTNSCRGIHFQLSCSLAVRNYFPSIFQIFGQLFINTYHKEQRLVADSNIFFSYFPYFLQFILTQTRNTTSCNNRDDLLHPSVTLKISIFSEAYI